MHQGLLPVWQVSNNNNLDYEDYRSGADEKSFDWSRMDVNFSKIVKNVFLTRSYSLQGHYDAYLRGIFCVL